MKKKILKLYRIIAGGFLKMELSFYSTEPEFSMERYFGPN